MFGEDTHCFRQYRTTPVRQIARKLNKVELRFFVRVHKFDAGGLTPGKENLCAMTENMQADDVQRLKPRVVRCCLYFFSVFQRRITSLIGGEIIPSVISSGEKNLSSLISESRGLGSPRYLRQIYMISTFETSSPFG